MNSLFIGRWSPFHEGHKKLIDSVLNEGKSVVIAIRDTKLSARNPYTVNERIEMIRKVYGNNGNVQVIAIPDVEEVCYGRGVGWGVREIRLDEETEKISATSIRRGEEQTNKVKGFTVWFTGLPCSGKSTIASAVAEELQKVKDRVELVDGDATRRRFWPELGFSKPDRDENIKRATYLAQLLTRNGIVVVASFISPYREVREFARQIIGDFIEVYVKCPLELCIQRDTKGLYKKAISGELKEFTGISDPYEEPLAPEVVVETNLETVKISTMKVLAKIKDMEYI